MAHLRLAIATKSKDQKFKTVLTWYTLNKVCGPTVGTNTYGTWKQGTGCLTLYSLVPERKVNLHTSIEIGNIILIVRELGLLKIPNRSALMGFVRGSHVPWDQKGMNRKAYGFECL